MSRKLLTLMTILTASVASRAEVADSVAAAGILAGLEVAESEIRSVTPGVFLNPAMKQWMLPVSVSAVKVSYSKSHLDKAIYSLAGEGSEGWHAGAESYMKHRSSTLWGSASYSNGRELNQVWNESSDLTMIYPYVAADSIGGDIKSEWYALAGGYADHTDRWAWGATVSYQAGLHYRNVDPRPRNVTGRLDLSVGGAWRIPQTDYRLGLSAAYMRYKQSADITFVNELADNRIWHLTGLGTHYERFTSQGYDHSYQGHRLSGSIDLYPQSGRGVSLSGGVERFTFDHILTSLNNMPLQSAAETMWRFEAAWLHPGESHDMAVTLSLRTGSRDGIENIFGDAAAGIYPKIGELKMYRHSLSEASLRVLWQWRLPSSTTVALEPHAGYERSRQTYADPYRLMQIALLKGGLTATGRHEFGSRWSARAQVGFDYFAATGCKRDFSIDPSAPLGMQRAETDRYDVMASDHWRAAASLSLTRALTSRYALMVKGGFCHRSYKAGITGNDLEISISFIF